MLSLLKKTRKPSSCVWMLILLGGNAEVIRVDHEISEISLPPNLTQISDGRPSGISKSTGANSGDTLALRVRGGTYRSDGSWAWMKRAVYSYDRENWFHTSPGKREVDNGIYHTAYRQKVDHPTVWFAFALPYTPPHVRQLTRGVSEKTDYVKPSSWPGQGRIDLFTACGLPHPIQKEKKQEIRYLDPCKTACL